MSWFGGITFEHPVFLWIALLALPTGVAGWLAMRSMSRLRRGVAVAARTVLLLLIALALAGASTVRETSTVATIVVADVSGSVRRFADFGVNDVGRPVTLDSIVRRILERAQADRGTDDLLGLVAFGQDAVAVAPPTRTAIAARDLPEVRREGTDLAGAIRLAAGLVPPDAAARIVVLSDGLATGADPVEAARAAIGPSAGDRTPLTIDTVPIRFEIDREVVVERVNAPPRAAAESTVPVRVRLRAAAPAEGTLRLFREGEPVDADPDAPGNGRRLRLSAGTRVELIEVPLGPERLHRFEAVFEPDINERGEAIADTSLENNRAESFTLTPGAGSVLVLDGVGFGDPSGGGATLADTLRRAGLEVRLAAPTALPPSLVGLQSHDLIVLQNVPADALTDDDQQRLEAYARDLGGGLLFTGGAQAYGAGGWKASRLEPLMPVELDLPDRLVVPELALVVILDRSGSMGRGVLGSSRSQQQIANEAAARAIASLEESDLVGVVSFSNTPTVEVPLGPNNDPQRTAARIRSIAPDGGTNLGPAMGLARRQLEANNAKNKHVVILSDGRSQAAELLPGTARSMRDAGIRVSAIGIGDASNDDTLERIAQEGGGSFYSVVNPNVLPRIFLRAVRVVRSPLIREQPFVPVVLPTASPLIAGVRQPPALDGINLTRARDEPGIINAMATPDGEPLLAHWNVGLGQIAAFTSDAHDWAEPWLDWPGYQTFWAGIARSLARPDTDPVGRIETRLDGADTASISLDARDDEGEPIDLLSDPATVYRPDGSTSTARLVQTGPGRYEASIEAGEAGTHVIVAKPSLNGRPLAPVVAALNIPAGQEYRALRSDAALLERLAAAGGGTVRELDTLLGPDAPDLFARQNLSPRRARTPLWPALLAWAVVVFLFDVGTRRIAWDRLIDPDWHRIMRDSTASASSSAASAIRRAREGAAGHHPASPDPEAAADIKPRSAGSDRSRPDRPIDRRPGPGNGSRPRQNDDQQPTDRSRADDEPEGLLAAKRRASRKYLDES